MDRYLHKQRPLDGGAYCRLHRSYPGRTASAFGNSGQHGKISCPAKCCSMDFCLDRTGSRRTRRKRLQIQEAEKLNLEAKQRDVWVSLHGSYFLNFSGSRSVVADSKQRLIACVAAAEWMGAHPVVFQPA